MFSFGDFQPNPPFASGILGGAAKTSFDSSFDSSLAASEPGKYRKNW